jgi:2,3-bisphosphoglycerate-independent phosphoglycerate mutase
LSEVLVVFLDGVGIGPPDPSVNPFLAANLPTLSEALGGRLPTLTEPRLDGRSGRAFPLDACLGVPGTPQSGTGQIALLTGRNAPKLFGRHFGPWPPVRLRPLLGEENFLSRARGEGATVRFANAYPAGYPGTRSSRRVAAVPLAALAAGVLERNQASLAVGEAVASEIVNDGWIRHFSADLPRVSAEEAGANLARVSRGTDLTLFAHYDTDAAGHSGEMSQGVQALERVDAFLAGVLSEIDRDTLVLVASDHGNIEDVRGGHTRNPALGLAFGAAAARLPAPKRLTDLARLVLEAVKGRAANG